MSSIRILLPLVSVLMLSACASTGMQGRVEQLETERQDLIRQNGQLMEDLTSCRARCTSLETALNTTPSTSKGFEVPDSLTEQGVNIKKNQYGQTVIDIPSDVFFPSGVADLSPRGQTTLREIATLIRQTYPGAQLRVEGHADSDPIRRSRNKFHCNWDLSLKRAHSVTHFFIDQMNFDPKLIACAGYGQFRPQDATRKAKNRRVEIVILQ